MTAKRIQRPDLSAYTGKRIDHATKDFLSQQNYNRSIDKRKDHGDIRFYPSSIGRCPRSVVYQMLGYIGTPKTGEDLLVLENGTWFHHRMEKLFKDMGILVAEELSIRDLELKISGRTDAIIWDWDADVEAESANVQLYRPPVGREKTPKLVYDGPEHLIKLAEFKSIKASGFQKLKTKPKPEHVSQLQLYFHLTGLTKGLLYYENKDNQDIKVYEVERDDELIAQILADIRDLVAHAERGELPARPYQPIDMPCRWCDFRHICHPNSTPFSYEDLFRTTEPAPSDDVPF